MSTSSLSSQDSHCPCRSRTCEACDFGSDNLLQDEFDPMATGCNDPMDEYPLHRDFRSQEKALNRQRKQFQKYYGYRGVKPSWIGQKYYTLVLIPTSDKDTQTTTHTRASHKNRRSRVKRVSRSRIPSPPQTENEQTQEADNTDHLPELCDIYPNNWWLYCYHDNYVSLCASEARASNTTHSAPQSLSHITRDFQGELQQDFQPTPLPPDTTLALILRTWTKDDNFAMKDTGIWPLDRRHHRGKKYREKRCWKETAKQLGHSGRTLSRRIIDDKGEEEIEWLITQHGEWFYPFEDWACCGHCRLELDVDEHFDGEFQDPREYWTAREALFQELKAQRIEEGDELWTSIFGNRLNEHVMYYHPADIITDAGAAGLEAENDFDLVVEDGCGDVETDIVAVGVGSDEDDAWSEISRCPSLTMSGSSEFDIVVLSEERGSDEEDDDVDWEMLS